MSALASQAEGVSPLAAPRRVLAEVSGQSLSWRPPGLAWPGQGSLIVTLGAKVLHLITILFHTSVCSSVKWMSDTWLQNRVPLNSNEFRAK